MRIDAARFVNSRAPFLSDKREDVLRAAHVAKHIRYYEHIARGYDADGSTPPITLTQEEKEALVGEKDKIISEKGIWVVLITISLAAFLQGKPSKLPQALQDLVRPADTGPQRLRAVQLLGSQCVRGVLEASEPGRETRT